MLKALMTTYLVLTILLLINLIIVTVSKYFLYKNKGEKGWAAFIPIYSEIIQLKIIGMKPLFVLIYLIPGVNYIFRIYTDIKFVLEYDSIVVAILSLFFPYVCYPLLATKQNEKIKVTSIVFGIFSVLFILFLLVATIPFESFFNKFTLFSDLNSSLSEFKLFGYKVFANLIAAPASSDAMGQTTGVLPALGAWTISDVATFLFIITGILVIISKKGINNQIANISDGTKKVLPIAVATILVSTTLVLLVNSGVGITIVNKIANLAKGFNLAVITLSSFVGSILVSSFKYFTYFIGQVILISDIPSKYNSVIAFIMHSIYHFTMIFAPTSILLIIGLYYLNIPYNKWLKYIWKVLLALLVIILIISIVIFKLV